MTQTSPEKNRDLTEEERNALVQTNIEQEFNAISRNLDRYHAIFYQIWEMGYPRLTFEVDTAAVTFDQDGRRLEFLFNPQFWKESDTYKKEFVICHECLHVILNHGVRIKDIGRNKLNLQLTNYALDIVVNHMLVDKFNFDRMSLQKQETLCWIDTVFGKDHQKVEKNRAFEYYYGLLKEKIQQNAKSGKLTIKNSDGSNSDIDAETLDAHELLEVINDESLRKKLEEQINENLNSIDKKDFIERLGKTGEGNKALNESQEAGKEHGGMLFHFDLKQKIAKKKKWETVIKKWSLKYLRDDQDTEQWAKTNRRIDGLVKNLMLPSDFDEQNSKLDRIEVWFFCDTSGSCAHFKDRFFKAARSLSPEKFILRLFSFDTKVYDVNIEDGKVYGGGGTSFVILERAIQSAIKANKCKYPEAVFVLTDGYGDHVKPEFPKRWYWFLSVNARYCIPKECNIHLLSQFE